MTRSQILNKPDDTLGISVHSLRKLVTAFNKIEPDEPITTPGKSHNRINKKVNIDSFQRSALHNIIYNFHKMYKNCYFFINFKNNLYSYCISLLWIKIPGIGLCF